MPARGRVPQGRDQLWRQVGHPRRVDGCRAHHAGCVVIAAATRAAKRRRTAIASGTWRFREPAQPAIDRVAELRAAGMSAQAIAEAAGLPLTVVSMLAWPERSS